MLGAEPLTPLGDQLLGGGGVTNFGNRWPADRYTEALTRRCVRAAHAVQRHWRLCSNWGLDFVIDRQGQPVIVDLNMGRPNGNFAVRLWAGGAALRALLLLRHTGGRVLRALLRGP